MVAVGATGRTVARGEDHDLSLLGRQHVGPRLRARPLLEEEEFAALVIGAAAGEKHRELQRERDLAVQVLVQAVVSADLVVQQERRRFRLTMPGAYGPERSERRWKTNRRAEGLRPAVGDRRQPLVRLSAKRGDDRRQGVREVLV